MIETRIFLQRETIEILKKIYEAREATKLVLSFPSRQVNYGVAMSGHGKKPREINGGSVKLTSFRQSAAYLRNTSASTAARNF